MKTIFSLYSNLAISPYDIEHREMNRDGSDLYSWITDDSSAISEEFRVYLLPSIEFDFWNKILNKKTGYLNVQSQGIMDRTLVLSDGLTMNP